MSDTRDRQRPVDPGQAWRARRRPSPQSPLSTTRRAASTGVISAATYRAPARSGTRGAAVAGSFSDA
jgi:hypothetical protein